MAQGAKRLKLQVLQEAERLSVLSCGPGGLRIWKEYFSSSF